MRKILLTLAILTACLLSQAAPLVLQNSHARLEFSDGPTYAFTHFVMDGQELLPPGGSTAHPWALTLLGPKGENPGLNPRTAWYDGGTIEGDCAVFTWRLFLQGRSDYHVRMKVRLPHGEELPLWSLEAEMPQGWVVTFTEFPRITLRKAPGSKAVLPIGYGCEYLVSGTLRSDYPSCTGGMQLALVHSPEGTVFFSARDKEASRKSFIVSEEGQAMTLCEEAVTSYAWTDDGVFRIPWESVLGFSKAGWEETALRWYRPFTFETVWGAKTLKDRNIVRWIENADMWLRPYDKGQDGMEALREALELFGKGTGLHWYHWHKYPFDTNYPDYLPAHDGFRDRIVKAHKMGGYSTPYINGRLWDPANETYDRLHGSEASCRKPDGSLYTEVYGSKAVNTVTCPASPLWQDVMKDVCRRILKDYRTEGVYIDQIGAAICEPCYAEGHPHPKGAGGWWPAAYRDMLQDMRAHVFGKDKAITTEENAECYIDLFDMMLVVNSPHQSYVRMVPLFPLIYADRCVYSGFTYIPGTLNDGSLDYISAKSLLWGSQLGWVEPTSLMKKENAAQAAFLKTLSTFRKANHDLFFGGRFMGEFTPSGDNPPRAVPGYETAPVVLGARWENTSGQAATLIVNRDSVPHDVIVDGKPLTIEAYSAIRL